MTLPKIKTVVAIKKYVLFVEFEDGTSGNYDISHLANKGVFKSWDFNYEFFNVSIDPQSGAITWSENLDIDTLNVYCSINNINVDSYLTQEHHATY